MMDHNENCYLVVYFYGGPVGYYKCKKKICDWALGQYARWVTGGKDYQMEHGCITLKSDDFEHSQIIRCDRVSGLNVGLIDHDEEALKNAQVRQQLETFKKMGKFFDSESHGEEWKDKD